MAKYLDETGLKHLIDKIKDGTLVAGQAVEAVSATTVPASGIDGIISIENLPKAALERIHVVANDAARFALTTEIVQAGDTVKVNDTGKMYFVVDDSKLDSDEGYIVYSAGSSAYANEAGKTSKALTVSLGGTAQTAFDGSAAVSFDVTPSAIGAAEKSHVHAWSDITSGVPTTVAGYGITDAKIVDGTITLGTATIKPVVDDDYVHTDNNLTDELVTKINGAVQEVAEGATNGTISVDGTDVSVHGLGSAAFVNTTTFDAAGTASGLVDALNATESGASNGVSVTVTETKGKITAVDVTAPDFANLYDEKGAATTAESNVKAIIGDGYSSTNTVASAISALEEAVGEGGSVSTQITNAINLLDATKSGSSNGVEVTVTETDGKITDVTVVAPDFSNTYEAKDTASTLIAGLSGTTTQAAATSNGQLALSITEAGGKITAISGSITANTYDAYGSASAVLGNSTDAATANTVYGAKAAAKAAQDAIDAYSAITNTEIDNFITTASLSV